MTCSQAFLTALTAIDRCSIGLLRSRNHDTIIALIISGTFAISGISATFFSFQSIRFVRFATGLKIRTPIIGPTNSAISSFASHANVLSLIGQMSGTLPIKSPDVIGSFGTVKVLGTTRGRQIRMVTGILSNFDVPRTCSNGSDPIGHVAKLKV